MELGLELRTASGIFLGVGVDFQQLVSGALLLVPRTQHLSYSEETDEHPWAQISYGDHQSTLTE